MQFPVLDWHRRFEEFPWNGAFCKDEQPQLWEYIAWFSSKVHNKFILFCHLCLAVIIIIIIIKFIISHYIKTEASVLEFLSDFWHGR